MSSEMASRKTPLRKPHDDNKGSIAFARYITQLHFELQLTKKGPLKVPRALTIAQTKAGHALHYDSGLPEEENSVLQ